MKQRIVMLLDVTGSMGAIRENTIKAFNEYVNGLKKDSPKKTTFSLILFSSLCFDTPVDNVKVADIPELTKETYRPNGSTPLLDSVGKAVKQTENSLKEKEDILLVVFTDGEENSSMEFSKSAVADLVKRKTDEGWTFVFMGANMDAWNEGESMAVPKGNIQDWESQNVAIAFSSLSVGTKRHLYRTGGQSASSNFWEED